jgi:hypothetical protein
MVDTITDLVPDLYSSLDVVSQELVGMIPSVTIDGRASGAAKGQKVRSFVAPEATASDMSPSMTVAAAPDQVIGNEEIEITKVRRASFNVYGEDELGENNGGPGSRAIQINQMAQAFRTLTNEVEADLAGLHVHCSRAYGTPGTTPFGTAGDYTDASFTGKILLDNGAPMGDASLVIGTAAGANIKGKQASVDVAGTDTIQRQGIILDINGFAIRQSGQMLTPAIGTGASATTDNAGYSVGDTVITLASAGTGTLIGGDVITFAGDTNKYVVESGDADVSNGGTITLAAPGLRVAMSAATKAITVVAQATRNMAFARSAIVLATRTPAMPAGGDIATDEVFITDPRSGLTFRVAKYKGDQMNKHTVELAWGVKMVKAAHSALLLG